LGILDNTHGSALASFRQGSTTSITSPGYVDRRARVITYLGRGLTNREHDRPAYGPTGSWSPVRPVSSAATSSPRSIPGTRN
jgi:hypothetical protein